MLMQKGWATLRSADVEERRWHSPEDSKQMTRALTRKQCFYDVLSIATSSKRLRRKQKQYMIAVEEQHLHEFETEIQSGGNDDVGGRIQI